MTLKCFTGVHVTINWNSSDDDASAKALVHEIGDNIEEIASRHGSELMYRFMNDAYDGQDVFGGYGLGNLQKLSCIAQAYDIDGIFQELQNGGWLLTRANEDLNVTWS